MGGKRILVVRNCPAIEGETVKRSWSVPVKAVGLCMRSPQTASEEMIEAARCDHRQCEAGQTACTRTSAVAAAEFCRCRCLCEAGDFNSATGVYGKAVAEHSFAMLLMLQKKLNLYRGARKRTSGVILVQSHPSQMP